MKERLRQIIRENKREFLNRDDSEQYDTFITACILLPADKDGTSFQLEITCIAANSEIEDAESLELHDEIIPFTLNDFKNLMISCDEKYYEQLEFYIPTLWLFVNGNVGPSLEKAIEYIDDSVSYEDWSDWVLAFRIVDRTM